MEEEVNREIKKKDLWEKYQLNKNDSNYVVYKNQRDEGKKIVKETKQKMWEEFRRLQEENGKQNQKLLCRVIIKT